MPRKTTGINIASMTISAALAYIEMLAERQRMKYLTAGQGKTMMYLRKETRAKECLADPAPTSENYPMLAATIGVDGSNVTEVATIILARSNAWEAIGASIEAELTRLKIAINSGADIPALFLTIDWS